MIPEFGVQREVTLDTVISELRFECPASSAIGS